MLNQFGRDSELYIRTKVKNGVTIVEDSFFTAPIKIAKPFYDSTRGITDIMLMSASAGIMEGDYYRIDMELEEDSKVLLFGQSYTKIHRMKEGYASQHSKFIMKERTFLEYDPKPVIPFADSRFQSSLECHLETGAIFLYSDILTCGREKRGERFLFKTYKNSTKIYYQGELIFYDNQMFLPDSQMLEGMGFFEGYTHLATLTCFYDGIQDSLVERLYEILVDNTDLEFGLSKTKKYGVVVRIFGNNSDGLEKILSHLKKEIYMLYKLN